MPTLYQGLDELTVTLQGYLIPQHILKADRHAPGLLAGLARLRELDARDDTSLASDIAWAQAQYAQARAVVLARTPRSPRPPTATGTFAPAGALREWQGVIASLEALAASPAR
jgi:hypothetical protein